MSLLATYSAVLSKFTYDAAANFWKMDLEEVWLCLLLEAIDRLDGAENNPRTDVEVEGSDRDIAVDDGNPGPTCPVSFVGQGPRLRGPADPSSTPGGRKRARPADGGDNDDEAPDPSPSRPPKRARKTRSQTARGGGRGGRGGGRGGANNNP
ncbi:uncharacterized protein NECHADRAFT_82723 [Fusarium vanettenii 77-13-4]|uniref:Uncharacterized protein n=1 Tax=Fusarium vanettenii (strain ATCC MYA-4622 / CBS 123669 / FGSC 9596 / NRRL 45880 / 77-13-4) TaxID=660122 RepID=C7YY16_FUSV7|nr:uncharacterized protein NECHADRAFT_82723 [Fusarium vanettenii 77-13-4]EEU43690.1 predicted protein [Fusarium vanettenii 77-13-4]